MKKKESISKDSMFLVINLILAVVTMVFAILLTSKILDKDQGLVSLFLALSIGCLISFQILLFFVRDKKKDKIRAVVTSGIYIVAIICAIIASTNWTMFYISNAIVVLGLVFNEFLIIEKEKTKKGAITHILLGIMLSLLAIAIVITLFDEKAVEQAINISIITVLLLFITAMKKLLFPSVKLERIKLLLNIIIKTHTFDVIIGLLSFMIAASFVLPNVEDTMTNFWDALWYCFTVITTIGFGDFYATSVAGRILTVVLGIYGIVVVAIITSVVVNFYNEVTAKEKTKDIIE